MSTCENSKNTIILTQGSVTKRITRGKNISPVRTGRPMNEFSLEFLSDYFKIYMFLAWIQLFIFITDFALCHTHTHGQLTAVCG